jgi:hypothetical protein
VNIPGKIIESILNITGENTSGPKGAMTEERIMGKKRDMGNVTAKTGKRI